MKYIKSFLAIALVALFASSCSNDLPYPLDDVKHGVVIDVVRSSNTDGILSAGVTTGNYKLKLSIPKQQGDYSFMDHAQLVCVFKTATGELSSKVLQDNIKSFPTEIDLNIADIYKQFGFTSPSLNESLTFTTNIVLKDGSVVYGWNKYTGYNNSAFAGWIVDNRAYSSKVSYPVACPLVIDDFVGTATIVDAFWEETYDVELYKISDTKLGMKGLFKGSVDLTIEIDPSVHTVVIPKTVIFPTFYGNTNLTVQGSGTIDSCNGMISFSGPATVDQGSYGSYNWVIKIK